LSIFIDTSAFLALIDASDRHHAWAKKTWKAILLDEEQPVSTNYVLLETFAVAQSRLGLAAARTMQESFFPLITIQWIEQSLHEAGLAAVLMASRKKLSLVDCVSFETMRRLGINRAFTFDRHFKGQGYVCLP